MKHMNKSMLLNFFAIVVMTMFLALQVSPAVSGEYDNALKDVKGVKVLFNISLGDPTFNNIVLWAVRNVYQDETVRTLSEKPRVAIVFHGPAVKLLSSDRSGFEKKDIAEIDKFQASLREMKKEGVTLEVCLYAAKVMGVDPANIMPEIDQVGNGFISIAGYEAQGYSMINVP